MTPTATTNPALQTPELLLDRLYSTLGRAVAESVRMSAGPRGAELRNRLTEAMGKLAVRRLLWNARTVAITGLQGAGKTTFVLHLLGNSPDLRKYLPISQLRDEKLPILIREHSERGVSGGMITGHWTNHDFTVTEVPLPDAADFIRTVRNPPPEALLMTLRVPRVLFQDDEQGLLLTPGIEHDRDDWSRAARRAVLSSRQVAFVMNETQLADDKTPELLATISREFKGCRMLPVVTHCDDPAGDYQARKSRVAELIGGETLPDNVVAFGVYPPQGPTWADKDRQHCLDHFVRNSGTPRSYRQVQARQLVDLLEDDGEVGICLSELRDLADEALEKLPARERAQNSLIRHFVDAKDKARRALAKELEREFATHRAQVVRDIEAAVQARGGWDKFKTWAFGYDLKDKHYIEDVAQASWSKTTSPSNVAKCYQIASDKGLVTFLTSDSAAADQRMSTLKFRALLGFDPGDGTTPGPSDEGQRQIVPLDRDTALVDTLRMLPHWSLAWMGNAVTVSRHGQQLAGTPECGINQQFLVDTTAAVRGGSQFGRQLFASVVGTVMAADLADGSPAAVATTLKAAGVTVTPMITAVLAAGVAVAAAVVVGASIKRQLGAQDMQFAASAAGLVQAYEAGQVQASLDAFDQTMDAVEERLSQVLRLRLGYDDQVQAAVHTTFAVNSADGARKSMLEAGRQLLAMPQIA